MNAWQQWQIECKHWQRDAQRTMTHDEPIELKRIDDLLCALGWIIAAPMIGAFIWWLARDIARHGWGG